MDPMLLGETLSASAANEKFYGFWMPADGNDGVGGIDVFDIEDNSDFEVIMETKSSDEDDDARVSITTVPEVISAGPGLYKFDLKDAKDLVRYRLMSKAAGSIHFQLSQPLWAPN
tara:strand:+ start:655 stop:999 length:345 start_codon:yes stop_codon:yes gene_type:complete